jgi:mono/diheme cytochrome c family protein
MPGYPWLFDGSAVRPAQAALDVVNYLESLGRDARLAGQSGPRPLPGTNPDEERVRGMFCDCAIPRTTGGVPVWSVPAEPGEQDRFARHGAVAFARHCAGCHGDGGKGDGPAADALTPAPRDLSSARFSDREMSTALWAGKPGSSMPSWADLPPADLRGLVAHLRTFHRPELVSPPKGDEQSKAVGLFAKHCAVCHGATGGGDGVSAARLAPAPTSFREIQPDEAYAESVLADGVRGTTMPKWTGKLTAYERHLLAVYVRTLYSPKE